MMTQIVNHEAQFALICQVVGAAFGLDPQQLLCRRRFQPLANARLISMYLARTITGASYAQIGRWFERHHADILHAVRTVSGYMDVYPHLAVQVRVLSTEISARLAASASASESAPHAATPPRP